MADGSGRVARVMMNAELAAAREGRSFMLDHLRRAAGGFGYQALGETRVAALAGLFGATAYLGWAL